jgi:uncharacterized protein YukE
MPSWHPNWTDVRFDHAAAQAAIDACRSVASTIDTQSEQRARLAATAVAEWQGAYRIAFDNELARMLRQGADLAAALRAYATMFETASDEAIVEQRRREADRDVWRAERRQELADEANAPHGVR